VPGLLEALPKPCSVSQLVAVPGPGSARAPRSLAQALLDLPEYHLYIYCCFENYTYVYNLDVNLCYLLIINILYCLKSVFVSCRCQIVSVYLASIGFCL